MAEAWGAPLTWSEAVVETIVSRCRELESGGRMIDAIVTNTLLPEISTEVLTRLMEGRAVSRIAVDVAGGEFVYAFD